MTRSSSTHAGPWLLFAACVLVALLNEVSGGVLTVALPRLRVEIGASEVGSQLILTTGKLFLGALILAGGAFGDVYGRKRMLLIGVAIVAVSSILSAIAGSQGTLVLARALDGVGNAMVAPLALTIAVGGFPEGRRARIVSLFAGLSALGLALGPLGASLLVRELGWRLSFLSPLLIGLAGGLGVLFLEHEPKRPVRKHRVDIVGAALCAGGLLGVVFGCARATDAGWLDVAVILAVGSGLLCLVAFGWWERRTHDPLLDIQLFKDRTILVAIVVVIAISVSVSGSFLPLFYFLQTGQHHQPVAAVVRLLPLVVTAAILAPVAGAAAMRYGHRQTIAVGLLVAAAGAGVLAASLQPSTPYPVLLASLVLLGAGNIAVIGPATDLLLGSVPPARRGGASSLVSAAAQIGGALGIPIMVSALLATARPVFFEQMRKVTTLPDERIREAVAVIRRGVHAATSERAFEVPAALREQIHEASEVAFGVGVGRCFLVATIACVLCAAFVWFGTDRGARDASTPDAGTARVD